MENKKIKYIISWSNDSLIITLIITAILIFTEYKLLNNINTINITASVIILFICIAFFLQIPFNIKIEENKLKLNKIIGKLEININDIDEANILLGDMGIRLFGSGGLFGFTGYFKNKKLGKYIAYVMDTNNKFYIKLKSGKTYVFSCDDPEQLVSDIKNILNSVPIND